MYYSKPKSKFNSKLRWPLYALLLIFGAVLYFKQSIIEQYMRFALRNEHIIVSLSTTPHRINKMQDTLNSILAQNSPIKAFYLAVPYVFKRENIEYQIPAWLQNHRQINIIRTEDYGPATKLLGVLKEIALPTNTIIVTLDDDIKYPPNTVLHLAYMAMRNPDSAVGISGARPDYDGKGIIRVGSLNGLIRENTANAKVDILQGYAGIAYRKRFFDATIFDISNMPKECINSDDLVISFYLAKQNIARRIVANNYIDRYKIDFQNEISLDDNALHKLIPIPTDKHRTCIAFMKQQMPNVKF